MTNNSLESAYDEGILKIYPTELGARRVAAKNARENMGKYHDVYRYGGGFIVLNADWRNTEIEEWTSDANFPFELPSLEVKMVQFSPLKFAQPE